MNELIKIIYDENHNPLVSGRNLHEGLGVKTPYTQWFERMRGYGFTENSDFITDHKNVIRVDGAEMPQKYIDHILTLDTAKQIAMIQRTDKGKEIREYFIEVEKAWNSDEMIKSRALKIFERDNRELTEKNNLLESKCAALESEKAQIAEELDLRKKQGVKYFILGSYYEQAMKTGTDITLTETAKEIGCGRHELIDLCLRKKYLYRSQSGRLLPYANRTAKGVFSIKEYKPKGGYTLEPTIYVTIAGRAKLNAECIKAGLVRPTLPDEDTPVWELAEVAK